MTVRQLSYDDQLTSEEARERLKEVEDEFNAVRTKYTTGLRRYQWWMSGKDQIRLSECFGVLLPLSLKRAVQNELVDSGPRYEETVHYKSSQLSIKILDILSDFSNTGTRRLGHSQPIWRD